MLSRGSQCTSENLDGLSKQCYYGLTFVGGSRFDWAGELAMQTIEQGVRKNGAVITFQFRCLGDFAVFDHNGWRPTPPLRRGRGFLEYLVAHPRSVAARSTLRDAFWPESIDDSITHRLHLAVSDARCALRPLSYDLNPILCTEAGYRWHPRVDIWTDTAHLRECYDVGSVEMMTEAVELYKGAFLVGDNAEWITPLRTTYENLYMTMLERLAHEAIGRGDYARAADFALRLITVDRAHEEATRLVMRCFAGTGRRGLALSEYETLRTYLETYLGVRPTYETSALRQRIADGTSD